MGIHADDLRDAEQLLEDLHYSGNCDSWCQYCITEYEREKDRLADVSKLD